MNDAAQLKLAIVYDAPENRYTVIDHNLTPQQVEEEVGRWKANGHTALAVDQRHRHAVGDAQDCRTCRDDVKRSSGLTPTPKFKRRK